MTTVVNKKDLREISEEEMKEFRNILMNKVIPKLKKEGYKIEVV